MHGRPAAGVALSLWRRLAPPATDEWECLVRTATNADGRTDAPLLVGAQLVTGVYELRFQIGAYFARLGVVSEGPAFLDEVPIRFGVADADAGYHVPLLATPWSYGTYRGS